MHVGTHEGPLLVTPHLRENHRKALQWCLCEITNTWAALVCEGIDENSSDWAKEPKTQEFIVQPHRHSYQRNNQPEI